MNRSRCFYLLVCFLSMGAAMSGRLSGLAQEHTTITLTSVTIDVGKTGIIEGHIDCAPGQCGAFAVILGFDPRIVRVDSAEAGEHLGESVLPVENQVDNIRGEVRLAVVALGDDFLTGETVLLRLYVTGLRSGTTSLHIVQSEVGDLQGNRLELDGIDGQITVGRELTADSPPARSESDALCTVRADRRGVPVRVGAGIQRGIRGSLSIGVDIQVVGQVTDSSDNLWWQVHPPGFEEAEADRYWVLAEDVLASGDCQNIPLTTTSPVVFANPTLPQTTTGTESTPGTGSWGACGSCATCGYSANECLLSPTGECLWDPATCGFEGLPWPRGVPCLVAYEQLKQVFLQRIPPGTSPFDLNNDGLIDLSDYSLMITRCSWD